MRFVEILLVRQRGQLLDPVGVIQHDAVVTDAADAGLGTDGRHAGFDTRVAADALLGFARFPVVIHLLVRAGRNTLTPATALVLVDQDDAVFFALVDRAGWTGGHTSGVQTVVAHARQIHVEGILELRVNLLLHVLHIDVLGALVVLAGQIVFPVRAPGDLVHLFAGDLRDRTCRRCGFGQRRVLQVGVVESEGLVVIVDLRHVRIGEDIEQAGELAAGLELQLAVDQLPATLPDFLVFPLLRVTDAGLGFDVVEPGVFHALAVGPDVFTRHGAGVTANALVEVEDKGELCANFHAFLLTECSVFGIRCSVFIGESRRAALPSSHRSQRGPTPGGLRLPSRSGVSGRSSQSTSLSSILCTTTNSSRCVPTVP